MNMKKQQQQQHIALISYHWRQLANDTWATRYCFQLLQKYLNDRLSLVETLLLFILSYTQTLPLHLYISIECVGRRGRTLRYFYGVADGNAVATDGSLIGRNNTPAILKFKACTPGSWQIRFRGSTALNWQSSGVTLADIGAASERLKLTATATEPQLVYEKVCDALGNPHNSIVSHRENVALTEPQLVAMAKLLKQCQSHYHYKLIGNNCQNVAHDIVHMLKQSTFKPHWVPTNIHNDYLTAIGA